MCTAIEARFAWQGAWLGLGILSAIFYLLPLIYGEFSGAGQHKSYEIS